MTIYVVIAAHYNCNDVIAVCVDKWKAEDIKSQYKSYNAYVKEMRMGEIDSYFRSYPTIGST